MNKVPYISLTLEDRIKRLMELEVGRTREEALAMIDRAKQSAISYPAGFGPDYEPLDLIKLK